MLVALALFLRVKNRTAMCLLTACLFLDPRVVFMLIGYCLLILIQKPSYALHLLKPITSVAALGLLLNHFWLRKKISFDEFAINYDPVRFLLELFTILGPSLLIFVLAWVLKYPPFKFSLPAMLYLTASYFFGGSPYIILPIVFLLAASFLTSPFLRYTSAFNCRRSSQILTNTKTVAWVAMYSLVIFHKFLQMNHFEIVCFSKHTDDILKCGLFPRPTESPLTFSHLSEEVRTAVEPSLTEQAASSVQEKESETTPSVHATVHEEISRDEAPSQSEKEPKMVPQEHIKKEAPADVGKSENDSKSEKSSSNQTSVEEEDHSEKPQQVPVVATNDDAPSGASNNALNETAALPPHVQEVVNEEKQPSESEAEVQPENVNIQSNEENMNTTSSKVGNVEQPIEENVNGHKEKEMKDPEVPAEEDIHSEQPTTGEPPNQRPKEAVNGGKNEIKEEKDEPVKGITQEPIPETTEKAEPVKEVTQEPIPEKTENAETVKEITQKPISEPIRPIQEKLELEKEILSQPQPVQQAGQKEPSTKDHGSDTDSYEYNTGSDIEDSSSMAEL